MNQSSGITRVYCNPIGKTMANGWSKFRLGLGQTVCGVALTSTLGLVGVATPVAVSLMAVPSVHAYTTEDLLSVSWEIGEDYNALVRRAENAARTSAQQQFDSDILLTRVIITVLGENGSDTVPVLRLDVAREDWRRRPDPQFWATYFRTSRALLNLDSPASAPRAPQPAPAPAPATPPEQAPNTVPSHPASPPANPGSAPGTAGSNSINPVPIPIPATPAGETGLPRSILR